MISHTSVSSYLACLSLIACSVQADNQVQVISRIPSMPAQKSLTQPKKEVATRIKTESAYRRYLSSVGLQVSQAAVAHNELVLELLPRTVNELGLRLSVRHQLSLNSEKPANTVLFHGPPGLGKTEAAALVARQGGFRFVEQPSTGLVDKFQNSGAERFQAIIDEALSHYASTGEESFIFMDEFDAIGKDLNDADATMVTNRQTEQAALMHIWQTVLKYKDDKRLVFCFGTNKLKSLHKTFISRFREEHIIEFKLPDAAQRTIALQHYLKVYDFPLARELNISEKEAQKTLEMLVKQSDGMNLRALRDAVRSFKGQKSLSALSNDDLVRVAKYLKETNKSEFSALKTKIASMGSDNKIDAAIIALHEQLTGKETCTKASTNKELYDILMRTKAKDGYDWSEQMRRLNERLGKNVDPWLQRSTLYYYVVAGASFAIWQFFIRPHLNAKNSADIDLLVQQQVRAQLLKLGVAGAGIASAGAAISLQAGDKKD